MCCGAGPCEFGIFLEATCKFYFFVCLVAYASPMQSIEYMARSLIAEVNISTRRKVRRVVTQKHSFKIFVRQFTAGTSIKTRLRRVGYLANRAIGKIMRCNFLFVAAATVWYLDFFFEAH